MNTPTTPAAGDPGYARAQFGDLHPTARPGRAAT